MTRIKRTKTGKGTASSSCCRGAEDHEHRTTQVGRDQTDLSSFEYLKGQSFHNTSYNLFHPHGKINLPSTQVEFPVLQLLPCSWCTCHKSWLHLLQRFPTASWRSWKITFYPPPPKAEHTWFPSPLLVCHVLLPPAAWVPCHRACKRVMSPSGSALWSGRKGDLERGQPIPGETGFPQIVIQLPVIEGIQKERGKHPV